MRRIALSENEHGFTMSEMMVTLLIIATLTAVAVPMYLSQRKSAREAVIQADLRNVSTAVAASQEDPRDPFKAPVDSRTTPASAIDLTTQVPVPLSDGVTIQYEANDYGFCIAGYHASNPDNIWSYSTDHGGIVHLNCLSGATQTPPVTSPTAAPTTAPTTSPTPAPTASPTPVPTTPAPSVSPTPTPTPAGPRVVEYTATHTTGGMILKGKVENVDGYITLRASANPLTGQTGWYNPVLPNADGTFEVSLTKFTDTADRYWQLELGNGSSGYGTVLVNGKVSPAVNSTAPAVTSYTVTYTSTGANIKATVVNAANTPLNFRASASPLTGQTGFYEWISQSGNPTTINLTITQFKNTNPRYWQLEYNSHNSTYGTVLISGYVSSGSPVNSGP